MEPNSVLRHVVEEDGSHTAVCRACGHVSEVPLRHEQDKRALFVLACDSDGNPTEVTYGERAILDFSAHERHVEEAH